MGADVVIGGVIVGRLTAPFRLEDTAILPLALMDGRSVMAAMRQGRTNVSEFEYSVSDEQPQGNVESTLHVQTETDEETGVIKVSLTGELLVDITPVAAEPGHTVYVVDGLQVRYAKRKSAIEAAVREFVVRACDEAWERENPKTPAKPRAASGGRSSAANQMMETLMAQMEARTRESEEREARLIEMMESFMAAKANADSGNIGHQNGNHDVDPGKSKVRAAAKN